MRIKSINDVQKGLCEQFGRLADIASDNERCDPIDQAEITKAMVKIAECLNSQGTINGYGEYYL